MSFLPVWIPLQAAEPSPFSMLVPMGAIFLIFYFLLIRPQQTRQKEHDKMLEALAKGDKVVTTGGIHGEIIGAEAEVLTLEIANVKGERVRIKVDRARVERRLVAGDPAPAKSKGDGK